MTNHGHLFIYLYRSNFTFLKSSVILRVHLVRLVQSNKSPFKISIKTISLIIFMKNNNLFSGGVLREGFARVSFIFSLAIILFGFASHALAQTVPTDDTADTDLVPAPLQSTKQLKPDIDLSTGSFLYSYTIETPSGVSGLTPGASLSYNSQNTTNESIVGYGWNLDIPYIKVNNKRGTNQLYSATNKDFVSSVFGELVNTSGTTYIPKSASDIVSLTFTNNTWVYKDKAGTTYTYGASAASRQDDPQSSTRVYKWMLDTVRDANGNTITYTYFKNQGAIYPDQINYAGIFSVVFSRQANPFPVSLAHTGFLETVGFRISTITVKVSGSTRYSYALAYTLGDGGQRSLLSSVTQTAYSVGGSAVTLPPTVFKYKTNTRQWNLSSSFVIPTLTPSSPNSLNFNASKTQLADVNGDGKLDLVKANGNATTSGDPSKVWLNTGNGWTLSTTFTVPTIVPDSTTSLNFEYGWVQLADVNGDGLPDFVKGTGSSSTSKVWINTGTNWVLSSTFTIPTVAPSSSVSLNFAQGKVQLVDINADGLVDLVKANGNATSSSDASKVWINTGASWAPSTTFTIPTIATNSSTSLKFEYGWVQLADINGDGLPDIVKANGTAATSKVWLNTGTNWVPSTTFTIPPTTSDPASALNFAQAKVQLADVNGDGLLDLVKANGNLATSNDPSRVWLNTGTNWVLSTTFIIPTVPDSAATLKFEYGWVQLADVNGDGLPDFVKASGSSASSRVWLNTGTTWTIASNFVIPTESPSSSQPLNFANAKVQLADVNGDGLLDFVKANGNTTASPDPSKVWLNGGSKADYLAEVVLPKGGSTQITYAEKSLLDRNPSINTKPQNVQVVSSQKQNDGNGIIATTSYAYENGKFVFFTNSTASKFAGFEKVTTTRPDNSSEINYYHQGNASNSGYYEYADNIGKLGFLYRTDIQSSSGVMLSRATTKWESANPIADAYYIYPAQTLSEVFSGTPAALAVVYSFDTTKGNLTTKTELGTVVASTPLNISDTGSDKVTTAYTYATNGQGMYKVSGEAVVDQSGNKARETKTYYDNLALGTVSAGNATKQEQWRSGSVYVNTQKTYNSQGLVLTATDERGKTTSYTYGSLGLYPVTAVNPLGQTTSYVYDYALGKLVQVTDINNLVHVVVYDGLGRIVEQKEPDPAAPANLVTKTSFAYTDTANQIAVKKIDYLDSSNSAERYQYYDGLGRLIQERQESKTGFDVRDFVYNSMGQLQKGSLAYRSTGTNKTSPTSDFSLLVNYSYDTLGRLVSTSNAVGTTSYMYNGFQTTATDANGKAKNYVKDAYGNLVRVDEINSGSTYTTNYNYNTNANLVKITDSLGNVRNFSYDAQGNRLTAEDLHAPSDSTFGTWMYTYDEAGNVVKTVDPQGQTINYTYDSLNRKTSEDFTGTAGVEVNYTYDTGVNGKGYLTEIVSPSLNQTNTYTPAGSIKNETKVIKSNTFTSDYSYDWQGNLLTILNRDLSQVKYVYNSAGQLARVQTKENSASAFSDVVSDFDYAPTGDFSKIVYANGVTSTNTYDPAKLYRLTRKLTGNASSTLQDLSYMYDSVGNITNAVDVSQTATAKTSNFAYDDLYRLTQAAVTNSAAGQNNYTENYSYDPIGNITAKAGASYSYAGNTGTNFANPHAVTGIGTNTLTYDKNGNVVSENGKKFTWDYNNFLVKEVITASGTPTSTITSTYDPSGQRLTYSDGSVTKYYASPFFNKESTGKTVRHIFAGDLLLANITYTSSSSPKVLSFIHTDHLGGSSVVTDSAGKVVETTDYFPYGSLRLDIKSGTVNEQRKFAGSEFDAETGLNYMNARYQNPVTGKFISEDPAFLSIGNASQVARITGQSLRRYLADPQQLNSYSYARNNPLRYTDPTGQAFIIDDAIGFGVGGLIGAGIYAGVSVLTGQEMTWGGVVGSVVSGGIIGVGAVNTPETLGASNAIAVSMVLGGVGAGVGNSVKQGIDISTGQQQGPFNLEELAINTSVGAATGGFTEALGPVAKIPGLSSGRGNMNAIGKGLKTKLEEGTIGGMSAMSALKSAIGSEASNAYKTLGGTVLENSAPPIYDATKTFVKKNSEKKK